MFTPYVKLPVGLVVEQAPRQVHKVLITAWPGELRTATTAVLSQLLVMPRPFHRYPQTAAPAITMGKSLFTAMQRSWTSSLQAYWNQLVPYQAPWPHLPEASEVNWYPGRSLWPPRNLTPSRIGGRFATMPGLPWTLYSNECCDVDGRLCLTPWSRVGWSSCEGMCDYLQAWLSSPTKDSCSLRLHAFLSQEVWHRLIIVWDVEIHRISDQFLDFALDFRVLVWILLWISRISGFLLGFRHRF